MTGVSRCRALGPGMLIAMAVMVLWSGQAHAGRTVTFAGVGPVRLGMTAAEAQRALNVRLKKQEGISGDNEKLCWIGARSDGIEPGIFYLVERGKITRIDVDATGPVPKGVVPAATTAAGIGINSTEKQIRHAYGGKVRATENTDAGVGVTWMTVRSPDKRRGINFQIVDGRVTSFWTAMYPAILYYEGCL
jgi:hypothetical protein